MRLEETHLGAGAGTGEGVLPARLRCQEGFSLWAALGGLRCLQERMGIFCQYKGTRGEDTAKKGGFMLTGEGSERVA